MVINSIKELLEVVVNIKFQLESREFAIHSQLPTPIREEMVSDLDQVKQRLEGLLKDNP